MKLLETYKRLYNLYINLFLPLSNYHGYDCYIPWLEYIKQKLNISII